MNENKIASMEAVGELPDLGNLLLREGGYPHLVDYTQWQPADTKPPYQCLCEVKWLDEIGEANIAYQYWNGNFWGFACGAKDQAVKEKNYPETSLVIIEWREVQ